MALNSIRVANELIAIRRDMGLTTTNMEVNKLLYIAHGVHLALFNEPLLDEPIEAWLYGPVVPSVYHEAKSNRFAPIEFLGSGERLDRRTPEGRRAVDVLTAVVEQYRDHDAYALIALTHLPDSPWDMVTRGGKELRNEPIPNALIARHYRVMLAESDGPR